MKSISRSVSDRVKEKKKEKGVPPKTSMKKIEIVKKKTIQENPLNKKTKVEEKNDKKKPLNRKLFQSSDSEIEAEEDVQNVMSIIRRKVSEKRVFVNVPDAPLDNVSLHYESSVQKWKYVFKRRIAHEKELSEEALEYKEIMELLKATRLMKTVTNVGPCYETLVKEFIMNITGECNIKGNKEYRKVHVRGKCVNFPPLIINEFLGRRKSAGSDKVPIIDKIVEEITGGKVKKWPKKRLLYSGRLSVKYYILNRISASNWELTYHSSSITSTLAKLIF